VLPKAKEASLKALALDQNEGEAHSSLGMIYGQFEWNWRGEERELKRALELDSNSALTHERYADYLTTQRRNAEAVREINTALELDPFSPTAHSTASYVLRAAHQYDLALSEARRCLEIDPAIRSDTPFLPPRWPPWGSRTKRFRNGCGICV
jgi:Tfp pilus assembly protein PilF